MADNKTFLYRGKRYPDMIRRGNAVQGIESHALQFCQGNGLDIGATREWILQGAKGVNPSQFEPEFDAYNLPPGGPYDFIFSSHCLEHLTDPIKALEGWRDALAHGGCLFVYLPHPDMAYWLPQNNRKHLHTWTPEQMAQILEDIGFVDVIHSERDLYWSHACVGWRP